MLRIGICDDIYDARLVLRAALERVLEKRRVQGQFREFSSGEGLLRWLESHAGELDLVFLDMEMGELDGMETARRLRAADAGLQLVFVTGYAEHVFDGYSVGADFVRIHQRYLVRTGAVDRMEGGEVVLRDGRRLPVSRSCQPSALLAFTRAELEG